MLDELLIHSPGVHEVLDGDIRHALFELEPFLEEIDQHCHHHLLSPVELVGVQELLKLLEGHPAMVFYLPITKFDRLSGYSLGQFQIAYEV